MENNLSNAIACPDCTDSNIIKHGSYNGIQRYICKSCRRTFSEKTNTVFYRSQKTIETWEKYYTLLLKGISLRRCASILNMSIVTAFKWRHKYLNKLSIPNNNLILNSPTLLRHTNFYFSRKGAKNLAPSDKPKQYIYYKTDRSRLLSYVAINFSTTKLTVSKLSFTGKFLPTIVTNNFKENFNFNSYDLLHNSNDYFSKTIVKLLKGKPTDNETQQKYNPILMLLHFYILDLRKWIGHYRGVATKYLDSYLSLFSYLRDDRILKINEVLNI